MDATGTLCHKVLWYLKTFGCTFTLVGPISVYKYKNILWVCIAIGSAAVADGNVGPVDRADQLLISRAEPEVPLIA